MFGACYNCMYLFKNLIKLSYSAWYTIAKRISSVHYFNKGFLITLGQLYCSLLPPEANILLSCLMLILRLRAVDRLLIVVDRNGYAPQKYI